MLDGWRPTPGRGGRADEWRFDGRRLVGLWRPGRTQVRWRHVHRSVPRRVDLDRGSLRQEAWGLTAPPERTQRVPLPTFMFALTDGRVGRQRAINLTVWSCRRSLWLSGLR